MKPILYPDIFVFCSITESHTIPSSEVLMSFQEPEGTTLILKKDIADQHGLEYNYIASWIMISVQTSLDAVGITSKFSTALAHEGISCNVVAAFYHDHVFVRCEDAEIAMKVLTQLDI